MPTVQLNATPISARWFSSSGGSRFSTARPSSRSRSLIVRGSTTVAPKYTALKPLGDRVLVKIKPAAEQSVGGILLPVSAQSKPQVGEVVAVGDDKAARNHKIDASLTGTQVVYSKFTGIEVEFNGTNHLLLKEEDIIGILETDDIKDMKPSNDKVLLKAACPKYKVFKTSKVGTVSPVAKAEEKTAGGLYLTSASQERKPSIATVIAVGPGSLDGNGNRKPLPVSPGDSVLYSKFAGNDFKGTDGSQYVALGASELLAVLS